MAIFDWFNKPASNTMLDNSFRNHFYQSNVQPVQSGATNIRPTNWQALKNWTPWKAFMPQSMGGTFHTGGTPQALSALSKAKNFGLGALRLSGVMNPVGAAAMSTWAAPKVIDYFTKRDPNATESSLFGIDLTQNANEQATLPDSQLQDWGSPMGVIAGDDLPDPLPKVYPGSDYSPHRGFEEMQFDETVQTPAKKGFKIHGLTGILNALTGRTGADQSFGGYADGTFSRAGLFPQEVSNLQELADHGLLAAGGKDFTGTNVVSAFGDYNQHIADKKADFTAKLKDQDYMARTFGNVEGIDLDSIKTLEDMEQAYRTKYGKNAAIANRLNLYANFGKTATDKADIVSPTTVTVQNVHGGNEAPAARHDYSRDRGGGYTLGGGFSRSSKPGGDTRGHHSWAQGGRVGLYQGGDPTEWMGEQETITPFQLQQEEGVPIGLMASHEGNTRLLENLFEKYLDLGFSPAEAERLALEEFESMSQAPQEEVVEEGIARLV